QRQLENAIQYAIGNPSKSNNTDTAKANCSVSQNVCQSMAMNVFTCAQLNLRITYGWMGGQYRSCEDTPPSGHNDRSRGMQPTWQVPGGKRILLRTGSSRSS